MVIDIIRGENMDKLFLNNFNYIISYLPLRLKKVINNLNNEVINNIQEIRIRAESPVVLILTDNNYFITDKGYLSIIHSANCICTTQNEITEVFNKICDYSLHSHYEDVLNGYVTLKNGARVGLTGTAVFEKNTIKGIRNIDGLNFRVPRNIVNCSDVILNKIFNDNISNLLIAGPPSSGKTTILKDLIYKLSSGKKGKYYKVCVIDERKELSDLNNKANSGYNTDILYGFPKSVGISMAVRTLSPDIIICDEIGIEDIDEIIKTLNSGVNFVFTIHAKNFEELKKKYIFKKLYEYDCIDNILIINGFNSFDIVSTDNIYEVKYENNNYYNCDNSVSDNFNKLCEQNQTTYKSSQSAMLND